MNSAYECEQYVAVLFEAGASSSCQFDHGNHSLLVFGIAAALLPQQLLWVWFYNALYPVNYNVNLSHSSETEVR